MDHGQKKTAGRVVAGCGCFLLLILTAWMCFIVYVGIQGRGSDEEASAIIGAVTCGCSLPILVITAVGLFFAFRRSKEGNGS